MIEFALLGMYVRAGLAGSWISLRVVLHRRYLHLALGKLFLEISDFPF
jgi:hypothetical protein